MSGDPRACGVLLHPTALPGTPACGSFGAAARGWIDLLAAEGVGVWQLLPLAPTDGTGSPYSSPSGSALNPWLIDADDLVADGLITAADRDALPRGPDDHLDPAAAGARAAAIATALARGWAEQPPERRAAFDRWEERQRFWLVDHCRFMVIRRLQDGRPWWEWPEPLARRRPAALRALVDARSQALQEEALLQWQLQVQWGRLQERAHGQGVRLVGDLPFYVAHDSADVWSQRRLFSLRAGGGLVEQSGVPPDYFSATGQLWGTPVYRWWVHRLTGFRWWLQRLQRQLELMDLLRLDHFRALEAYWSVPGADATAEHGCWRPSPGGALLARLRSRCRRQGRLLPGDRLPLIAEDLGVITPAVEALRDRFALPGMKILQFAFDGNDDNPYLPANYSGSRWVVYTGTHDNATSLGWWRDLDDGARGRVAAVVGAEVRAPSWQLLEVALASPADLAVVPLQDLLELGDEARFNTPGTIEGNWSWRLSRPISSLAGPLQGFGAMAARYGRGRGAPAGAGAGGG
ncbi:4-alpha-glucanotransferase [Cyanobium sp. Copco_Reservoir_LC18]|uniref:4-alpha-glucanotransferase n=1 Tax=Cyanobium sp. Copco_Reservoir_LC18 TaxID=1328305 RepID=UPI00135B69FC|nr:4-alpha-glucanotransferase [Cyanobium sp. Copco_Reservoir_LC18]KAF0654126.1 4-alpha-glucanotransferase [Cyanobium sp. Copco_Reservoir_LC18]